MREFRNLTKEEQKEKIHLFKNLPTQEKNVAYCRIQGTNFADDDVLKTKFPPIQNDTFGQEHPPPNF